MFLCEASENFTHILFGTWMKACFYLIERVKERKNWVYLNSLLFLEAGATEHHAELAYRVCFLSKIFHWVASFYSLRGRLFEGRAASLRLIL